MVVYHLWDLTVDTAACRIQCGEEEIRLTPKEYELLLLFLRNRGRALYRDYLYETVWGEDDIADSTRTLDTHITRLRRNCIWATDCVPCAMWVICWKKSKIVAKFASRTPAGNKTVTLPPYTKART